MNFKELLKKLNKEQREAVEAIEGPVMVVAGPGTGKTTVLTLRIASILQNTDTPPDAILALTFSESGAATMRRKLSEIIGPEAYRVNINTFHGFANDLIKTYPDKFPRIIGSEHMEDLEARRVMQAVIDETKLKILRPKNAPDYYIAKCLSAIKELKRENISPAEFRRLIAKRGGDQPKAGPPGAGKTKELARVYIAYEKKLAKKRFYDYEDMIMETVRVLERDKDFLMRIQESAQYILADEHQDANNAQNRLLELLSSYDHRPNLFIVGDEKQAIYRFQGASLENFSYFQKLYPKAHLISLTQNYRSHQKILDAAHQLILNNPILGEAPCPLLAQKKASLLPKIIVAEFGSREEERAFIAWEIKKRKLENVAILTRENKDAEPMERALVMIGVPATRFSGADALSHIRIDSFLQFLQAVVEPTDEVLGKVLFFDFLNLPPHEVFLLLANARKNRQPILAALHHNFVFKNFTNQLSHFAKIAKNEPLVWGFNQIASESDYRNRLTALPDAAEVLPLFEVLLRAVERFAEREKRATVADFLKHLAEARKHEIEILTEPAGSKGVAIMTAHRAKGLEFDTIFILHSNDGVWGGRRHRSDFELPIKGEASEYEIADERRLFYVALTRARKEIVITHHTRGEDNRERLPSRFIAEIGERHLEKVLPASQQNLSVKSLPRPKLLADKNYLNALFLERGLSVTHLNNYLQCPWRYFFVDLIRLPQSQSMPLLYGSAIHAALKNYFDAYAREEDLSVKEAVKLFEKYLYRTHLGERDFRAASVAGKKELAGYLHAWDFPRAIFNEYKIAGVSVEISAGQTIELNGKLDKVELLTGDTVNVLDYKTGKPKSRNEIEGKTKNNDGNYKRQLVFYKLLVDGAKRWRMKSATLDFIQPMLNGKYRREVFEISDEEAKELMETIKTTSREILNLTFWNHRCNDKDCEYCRLSDIINL
ncbi:MAG: ATP-dependent DNA helicase [Candidatus Paceibacterota bacterium]